MRFAVRFHSVSARVTLAGTMATACVLGVAFVLVWYSARWVLEREFDTDLRERSENVVALVAGMRSDLTRSPFLPWTDADLHHVFLQIHLLQQQRVIPSRNLGEHRLPFVEPQAETPRFVTWNEEELLAWIPDVGSVRIVSVRCTVPEVGPVVVQVGASRAPLLNALRTLRNGFFLLLPLAVGTTALVSRWWVRRALREIDRVAAEASRRDREVLFEPLPVPPGDDAMTRLVQAVNALLDRSRKLSGAKERFNAYAAHELKSPVARMLGHAQVLLQRERPLEEHRKFAHLVEEEMRRLRDVMESVLVLARLDQSARHDCLSRVTLDEVATDALAPLDAPARERKLTLRLDLPDEEVAVEADPGLLTLALGNLVRNALRFAPEDSTIVIRGGRVGALADFVVEDRGPGFPADLLERGFEPFTSSDGGSGLGLALAAGVARVHGGSLEIENREDGGARARLRLPASPPRGPAT